MILIKAISNESNNISGNELHIYTNPTIITPFNIIIHNKIMSSVSGFFKGLKKLLFMFLYLLYYTKFNWQI